ncbi:MAG: aminotransferase class III-fold pyridoxal phosphate-dependent enzyme [Woeseia sp.]|nr:aminotransferase class III-fold pyridoxal phosphate-dependent enzyme [Woeseia sp.]NNL54377.1 aminotransferase class III-fold pyridoxal phosphate-dependent enzyme [Woeseia sp.]
MRETGGVALTQGLSDETIRRFIRQDSALPTAIERAFAAFQKLETIEPDLVAADEATQMSMAQSGIINFYATDAVNPYVAVAAQGPWIVTLKGAVVYDCGGYGMLGFGHVPDTILAAMNGPHVMANIMTPNVSQMRFVRRLRAELGHTRKEGNPFERFLCLNSGSESVTVASRIADVNAKELTDPGARHEGREIRGLTLKGSFHGRTDRPARFSDSSIRNYRKHLASFQDDGYLLTVEPNNIGELESVFAAAEDDNVFIEAFFMEPVMGEGNPGQAITREFYKRARELTEAHGTMFMVDSIQAGLRAHGVLSIVDYPGFQDLPPPDMETYSKALNAGQYPLSVLALAGRAATLYRQGVYGNTMTSNPRALDVAVAVLDEITPAVRENIQARGKQMLAGLAKLKEELGDAITKVQGTGLLLSCELHPRYKCYGANSTEEYLRKKGLGVIHGGKNSLRYTPSFLLTAAEADLVVALTRDALINGPISS